MYLYVLSIIASIFFSFILVCIVAFASVSAEMAKLVIFILLVMYLLVATYFTLQSGRGKRTPSALFLTAPPFLLVFLFWVYVIGHKYYLKHWPQPVEFEKECLQVGPRFFTRPQMPVNSIAFDSTDWDLSGVDRIEIGNDGLTNSHGGCWNSGCQFPKEILFTEQRNSSGKGDQFDRFNNNGKFEANIGNISADISVFHSKSTNLREKDTELHEITVSDRRDSEILAQYRYVINRKRRLACGFNKDNVIDEKAFILQAIGY